MSPRTRLALATGKAAGLATRIAGRGGTALPGLVATRIAPNLLAELSRQLGGGRVLITGTNGKTTTARMLASILDAADRPYIHNREGSNLVRGLASSLMPHATLAGRIPGAARFAGIFETDEATLPAATAAIQPQALVFTNLFRDQLDRYGEVDTVAAMWREALAVAPADATLVLNADDPSVAALADGWRGPVHWFGIDDPAQAGGPVGASDARWCPACGSSYAYGQRFFAHTGHWSCPGCGRRRAEPETQGRQIELALDGAAFDETGLGRVETPLSGLYNVWNALAAIAAARCLGVGDGAIHAGLAAAAPAFGRQERIQLGGTELVLLLAKNPAGANQVIRLLAALEGDVLDVCALLNDRFADGQDVSWTWDVDYDFLAGRVGRCWAGGDRAEDMALRLRYAGWPSPLAVEHAPARLLDAIQRERPERVFVLTTYSALLDFRAELVRRGAAASFWRQ